MHRLGGSLDGSDDFEVILQSPQRRHENVEHTVSRLSAHCSSRQPGRAFTLLRCAVNRFPAGCRLTLGLKLKLRVSGQRRTSYGWIRRKDVRIIAFRSPRLRLERQSISHRRVARNQITPLVAKKPGACAPVSVSIASDRKHFAHDPLQTLRKYTCQPSAFELVIESCIERIDVGRQATLAPEIIKGILIGRKHIAAIETKTPCNAA